MAKYFVVINLVVALAVLGTMAQRENTDNPQCGQSNPSGVQKRVVSGSTALPGAWPWQALLLLGRSKKFVCSGALIHPSWVLTAAHCIKFSHPHMYTVRLGEFNRARYESHEQDIKVEKIIVHPHHDSPTLRNNDLALIKLKNPAVLTKHVSPVCLPTAKDFLHGKLNCYATGWGMTKRSHTYSMKLQQARVPLVTKRKCRMRANHYSYSQIYSWPFQTRVTDAMLCGGDDSTGASTCLGDSGGPYVCRNPEGYWVLQGITSWGSKRCLISERYSVFSKVGVFVPWIEKVMNGTDASEAIPKSKREQAHNWSMLMRWLLSKMLTDRS